MATVDRRPAPLEVVGQVMVEMGGESARIEARGDRIVLELPSYRAAISAMGGRGKGRGRREAILRVHRALIASGLTLELVVGGSTVGLLGQEARSRLASRILGFGPLEIQVRGVLGSLRRRPERPTRDG